MRYIFEENEENYELEDKLQDILDEKNIDFDYDDDLRLVVSNENSEEVESIMKSLNLHYEIYEGGDNSYQRYLLNVNNKEDIIELENALNKENIDFDYDSGDRIMIPTIDSATAENIFDKMGIDYDLI